MAAVLVVEYRPMVSNLYHIDLSHDNVAAITFDFCSTLYILKRLIAAYSVWLYD